MEIENKANKAGNKNQRIIKKKKCQSTDNHSFDVKYMLYTLQRTRRNTINMNYFITF